MKPMDAPLFDAGLIARAVLSDADAAKFRAESRQSIITDEETQARVVFYVHPNGAILMDAVRLHQP